MVEVVFKNDTNVHLRLVFKHPDNSVTSFTLKPGKSTKLGIGIKIYTLTIMLEEK